MMINDDKYIEIISNMNNEIKDLKNKLRISNNRVDQFRTKFRYYKDIAENQSKLISEQKKLIKAFEVIPDGTLRTTKITLDEFGNYSINGVHYE